MYANEGLRYWPYILKRLTDFDPSVKDDTASRTITMKQLKEDIFEHIEMLFNSKTHLSVEELKDDEELESSVLGYGIADYCGSGSSDREDLMRQMVKQLHYFEPRLVPDSITVEFVPPKVKAGSFMEFQIGGLIQGDEAGEELVFIARLDMETGSAELKNVKD
ncbi:MAG: GPW/gp25 family protein [Treponema sp.]|jgi:type VI secretion system protein ImpF|nr:GPW/gp25 family protein [Treponema sp.]